MRGLCVVMLVAVSVAAAAGCAIEGRELREWTAGDGARVELPGNRRFGSVPKPPYVLRSTVALSPEERGQALTVSAACFHDTLGLRIDGVAVTNVGDVAIGEHRFLLEARLTDRPVIDLELVVDRDTYELGFGLPPRLIRGVVTTPSWNAQVGRIVAIADLTLICVFSMLFGLSYLLDRKRVQDAAFAAGALMSSVAALTHLGVMQHLGVYASLFIYWSLCGTMLAVLYFVSASFAVGAPPRSLVRTICALAVLAVPTVLSDVYHALWLAAMLGVNVWFVAHVVRRLRRESKSGQRRGDAKAFIITLVALFAVIAPDMIGLNIGRAIYGGWHVLPLGAVAFTIAQAVYLAREQVVRQRELQRTAEELRRQVVERSRALADALAKLPREAQALDADRVIDGRYRVVRKLGAGGMGAVYEVERLDDSRHLALKTLRGKADPDLMSRFAREAQIAAELSHPHLVPVLDVGISDGGLFLVMPLLVGGSLEGKRASYGDARWALPMLRQIASGLAALHARDIIHRDLKPANVLVADDQAQIADFGLASLRGTASDPFGATLASGSVSDPFGDTLASGGATDPKASDAFAATAAPVTPALTQRGDIFGTPGYMAPELAAGVQNASPASDVFAFGVIAYELLTGKQPFVEPPVLSRLHGRSVVAPSTDGLPAIIARCLELEAAKRPTAADIERALASDSPLRP